MTEAASAPPIDGVAVPIDQEEDREPSTVETTVEPMASPTLAANIRRLPPPPPPGVWAYLLVQAGLIIAATLATEIYQFVITIIDGCFFQVSGKDFDRFKHTGRVCDASFWVNLWIGMLLGGEMNIAIVGGLVALMRAKLAVMVAVVLEICWQFVRIVHLIVFATLPLPFWTHTFPVILANVFGLVTLGCVAYVYHICVVHDTEEDARLEALNSVVQNTDQLSEGQPSPGATSVVQTEKAAERTTVSAY